MTGFLGPGDPGSFDEFLARFLGPGARGPARRIDLTRLMSAGARELVATAAQLAIDRGDPDLDAQHLLLASTRLDPTRMWLDRAGVDPDELARMLDERLHRSEPTGRAPALTPAAKRALLDGHQVSRSLGSTYIGPEHVLLAIAANEESAAGRLLARPASPPAPPARPARPTAARPARAAPRDRPRPPPSTSSGRTSPPPPERGDSTRSSGAPTRSSRRSRCCRGAPRTTRC